MRRGLVVLLGMALLGLVALAVLGRSLVGTATGVDEALALQDRIRSGSIAFFESEPPLRVYLQPGGAPGAAREWRWRVDGTLRAGVDPVAPGTELALERIRVLCLGAKVQGKPTAGVILRLRRPGQPDWERAYDGSGVPVRTAPPPAPAPPPVPAPGGGK